MKKIAIMVSIGFIFMLFSVSANAMALCANTDYNIFLMSQGTVAPADLINENAYETKTEKFNLSYDLINLTPDVFQARIELYRYLDEEAPNDGWKLEETLTLDPPFQSSIPIVFEDLKRGKTYSITLIVVTDMPNLSLGDGSPPIDMTVKTIYFLWPKEHGMHLSATTSFEGAPRREHFKMKWSAAEGAAKTKVKARHSDNTENPIVESSSEGELTFSREEVWAWPADNLSSISVDALDSGGNAIATTGFIISPIPPIKDYKILPCIPASADPEGADMSGPDDRVLNDGIIKVVVSETFGGAFFTLKLLSQNVNYTVAPQPSEIWEFTPAYRPVAISGSNVTQVDFTAKRVIIKGTVTDLQGNGLSGITITAGGATAVTDMTGSYYFTETDLPPGNWVLAPSVESAVVYTFAPSTIPVTISSFDTTITEQNFTATGTGGQYKISGTITLENVYLSSMDVELSGTVSMITQRQGDGAYQFTGLPNGSYTVTPIDPAGDLIIGPAYANVTISGQDVTNINFVVKPPIIKGVVATSNGNGVSGIKMKIGSLIATTGESGEFAFSHLEPGDYTLEPSEEDAAKYTFDPPNRKIKIKENDEPHTGQDFKATPK